MNQSLSWIVAIISASEVVEPLIYTSGVGQPVITVGRYDAYQILTKRSKQNSQIARAVSLLRSFLAKAENSGQPIDSAAIYPDLSQLKGSALADAMLVRHELMLLFSSASKQSTMGTPFPPSP